jgi:chromosome segregation ATPase
MVKRDKLSKEVEDQIQGLASDVYIQIEEKLTQLICAATPKESDEKVIVEQTPAYVALQNNFKTHQQEFIEKSQIFSEKTNQLEQDISNLQKQLADEQSKYSETRAKLEETLQTTDKDSDKKLTQLALEKNELKQQLDAELAKKQGNEVNLQAELAEQKQEVVKLNEQLQAFESDSEKSQETYNSELNSTKEAFEKKIAQMNEQLQQAQSESTEQKKLLAEQEEKLASLEEQIQQQESTLKNNEEMVNELAEQKNALKEQCEQEKNAYLLKEQEQEDLHKSALEKITQLEKNNQEVLDNLAVEQSYVQSYQKEIETLTSQVDVAQKDQEDVLARLHANREKQEQENDKVRETIKYLRDENTEVTSQNNQQKEQFMEQIHELENKLTEYRLKFEYAQKQLVQTSNG